MKKLLALILCVMMFVAVIPTAAFATATADDLAALNAAAKVRANAELDLYDAQAARRAAQLDVVKAGDAYHIANQATNPYYASVTKAQLAQDVKDAEKDLNEAKKTLAGLAGASTHKYDQQLQVVTELQGKYDVAVANKAAADAMDAEIKQAKDDAKSDLIAAEAAFRASQLNVNAAQAALTLAQQKELLQALKVDKANDVTVAGNRNVPYVDGLNSMTDVNGITYDVLSVGIDTIANDRTIDEAIAYVTALITATEKVAEENQPADEPKTDEPAKEEPKTDEPAKEEPKTDEPAKEEPKPEVKPDEPKTDEPAKEDPKPVVLTEAGLKAAIKAAMDAKKAEVKKLNDEFEAAKKDLLTSAESIVLIAENAAVNNIIAKYNAEADKVMADSKAAYEKGIADVAVGIVEYVANNFPAA